MIVNGDKGLIFVRSINKFHKSPERGSCLSQWSESEIGDPTDKERWYKTNPSLGYQLLESALVKDSVSMSPDTFAREHLGFILSQSIIENHPISEKLWNSCVSSEEKPEGKTAYGVKFSMDGSKVALCGAVIPEDGPARISLIDYKSTSHGTQWLADWLNARYNVGACVVIDGKNGVDVLIDKIKDTWKAKNSIIRPSVKEVIAATSTLMNDLAEKNVTWYKGQEILKESALSSTKRKISGGFGFGGENSMPIEACSLALYGAKTTKRVPGQKMLIG